MPEEIKHIQAPSKKNRLNLKTKRIQPKRTEPEEPMVTVWRYSSKNGRDAELLVTEGSISKKDLEERDGRYHSYQYFHFNKDGRKRIVFIPFKEGDIKQGVLWLRDRDDQKAIELFRQDALKRIETFKRHIKNREAFIENVHVKE